MAKRPPNTANSLTLSLSGSQIGSARKASNSARHTVVSTSISTTRSKRESSARTTKSVSKTKGHSKDADIDAFFNTSKPRSLRMNSARSVSTIDNNESVFSQTKVKAQPKKVPVKKKTKFTRDMAASIIQNWFRRHKNRGLLRNFLDSKKKDFQSKGGEESERDKRKRREEKARKARQEAIKELHKKREMAKEEKKKIAEDEIKFLKETGKIVDKKNKNKETERKKSIDSISNDGTLDSFFGQRSRRNSRSSEESSRKKKMVSPMFFDDEEENHVESEKKPEEDKTSKSRTTFTDLIATLEELEEPKSFPDHDKKLEENLPNPHLSDDKLRSIMSYLNHIETKERFDELDLDPVPVTTPLVPSAEEIEQLEQATATANELTQTVLSQKIQVEDKSRRIKMLQRALDQQRELTIRHAKDVEREMQKRLEVQKTEYEETVKRHLGFIDQLIDDKKVLSEKCEKLVVEMKTKDKKYTDKISSLKEQQDVELKKLKEVSSASEKLRRERWIDEKTKKIKEMTVKGLEPEIQKLIADHKAEIKKIKSIQEAELLESDERAAKRYVKMIEELRDQLAEEKEAACARERELARQTYEKQIRSEEEALQQQRRRLFAEIAEEKDRLAAQNSRMKQEMDRQQIMLEQNARVTSEATRKEYEVAREEQERRHMEEMRQLKEKLEAEKEGFRENLMKKQDTWTSAKERELKDKARKERDKEIEIVISQLEEDNRLSREECERVAENRLKRLREKYEKEMNQLEQSEKDINRKYLEIKKELLQVQGDNETLRVTVKQKGREIDDLKALLDQLQKEKSNFEDVVRQELADKIARTEQESKNLKNELSECKAKHKAELDDFRKQIERVEKSKEDEMEEVHKRVKAAVEKKEEIVKQLRQQYDAALKRADHLEGLLQQQRRQLLDKK